MSQQSYRHILKTTSLFGSVQFFSIIINLVKSKVIAVFLGTTGYAINNLFQTPVNLILSICNLGIPFSATREIANADSKGDQYEFSLIVKTLKKWIFFTGMLGIIVTVFISPQLSQWSFNNTNETWSFIYLSLFVLLMSFGNGNLSLLQGTRKHKEYAKSVTFSTLIGLLAAIPLYYFWGTKGIVPAIIISSVATFICSWYYSRKIQVIPVTLTQSESIQRGKQMIRIGIPFNLGALSTNLMFYLTILYIENLSGKNDVALFSAGWSITSQYVGLIFSAMSMDYFPRISALHNDVISLKKAVNEQAEISVLIVAPLIILYLMFLPLAIRLFLSSEFMAALAISQWFIAGIIFKTASWTLGFVSLAKGNTKLFLILEIIGNSIFLAASILGFTYWGLEGIGIGFTISYILNFLIVSFVVSSKFEITLLKEFQIIFLIQILLIISMFILSYFVSQTWIYITGSLLFIASAAYSLYGLEKRIKIKDIFILKFKNKNSHE